MSNEFSQKVADKIIEVIVGRPGLERGWASYDDEGRAVVRQQFVDAVKSAFDVSEQTEAPVEVTPETTPTETVELTEVVEEEKKTEETSSTDS